MKHQKHIFSKWKREKKKYFIRLVPSNAIGKFGNIFDWKLSIRVTHVSGADRQKPHMKSHPSAIFVSFLLIYGF